MVEAIFGLIGVLVGSGISWFQTHWMEKKTNDKNARYLAIRLVCILDKYLQNCAEVVNDDGLCDGQRNSEGCLVPQVKTPAAPVYPDDVDWKSIDHDLMYKILSFPSEVDDAKDIIAFTSGISCPPDYDEWFDERAYWYCQFGLVAHHLANELCSKYGIKKKKYNSWDPVEDLANKLTLLQDGRQRRISNYEDIIVEVLRKR